MGGWFKKLGDYTITSERNKFERNYMAEKLHHQKLQKAPSNVVDRIRQNCLEDFIPEHATYGDTSSWLLKQLGMCVAIYTKSDGSTKVDIMEDVDGSEHIIASNEWEGGNNSIFRRSEGDWNWTPICEFVTKTLIKKLPRLKKKKASTSDEESITKPIIINKKKRGRPKKNI